MTNKTETSKRFEKCLIEFNNKLNGSELKYKDGIILRNLSENLLIRYEQIRKSRDKWKDKYTKLNSQVINKESSE